MIETLMVFGSALWLGILTSISPCPLATNIAAVSFLSKKINHPKSVLWAGFFYTAGRVVSYALLGAVIIASLASVPAIANPLQKYINKILGPTLLMVGLLLLNVIRFNIRSFSISHEKQARLAESGAMGSFALGMVFALSFCPIAAALFFGSLIPLALNNKYGIILPFVYGMGTAIPVVLFSVGISLGVKSLSRWVHKVRNLEKWTRKITGAIFIIAGLYFIWTYILPAFM